MKSIIKIEHMFKSFQTANGSVTALRDINLDIAHGEIFGIIGLSGAGKSTLVRCINYLEEPTEGDVLFEGVPLGKMKKKELRMARQSMGMIFQQFNLLEQRNVLKNVCFPLELAGIKKVVAEKRAKELLAIVGLENRMKAYPAQLSGGQKQRVAIARAIATNPKVLLCDEATSALDPNTTKQILELLKDINQKMGITVIIITHEMKVIESVCDRVAIIADSRIAEVGEVSKVFADPQSDVGKQLIVGETLPKTMPEGGKVIRIIFDGRSSFEPMIANMVLSSGVSVNILGASTKNIQGISSGQMVIQLPKDPVQANKILFYLTSNNVLFEGVSESELRSTDHKYDY